MRQATEHNFPFNGEKSFFAFDKIRRGVLKNYFQGLKIYFQGLVIYFQGLIIYFQALKIISKHAPRQKYLSQAELVNMVRGRLPTADSECLAAGGAHRKQSYLRFLFPISIFTFAPAMTQRPGWGTEPRSR